MKIALIHGIGHQGSTWHYADLICQELDKLGPVEKSEFFLPRDMPHFCMGCYTCFYKGEENCPHRDSVKPIAEAMGWKDVSGDKKSKKGQEAEATAHRIYKSVRDIERIPNPVFRSIFFRMMVGMEKKNDWNPKDRNHWDEKGWLYGKRPF